MLGAKDGLLGHLLPDHEQAVSWAGEARQMLQLQCSRQLALKTVGPIGRAQLPLTLQVKFSASLVLPLPL
jgi:hypothetical protein